MTCLLDTHFLIWVISNSPRLRKYPWVDEYRPWGISPVSLLEMQFLAELGRGRIDVSRSARTIASDPRFVLDEVPFVSVVSQALHLSWTRDPFDRMIAAHSLVRRAPLCTVDAIMLENHKLIVHELR